MGLPAARMLDIGFGDDTCHSSTKKDRTGFIIQGAANVFVNGLPVARMLDIVMRGDGHSGVLIQGSPTVITNGLPTARMLDVFVGCFTGVLIQGSGNVFTG